MDWTTHNRVSAGAVCEWFLFALQLREVLPYQVSVMLRASLPPRAKDLCLYGGNARDALMSYIPNNTSIRVYVV